jgi:hypothetical protein
MGRRRYRIRDLRELCARARLDVTFASYFTSFGAAAVLGARAIRRVLGPGHGVEADLRPIGRRANAVLHRAALVEAAAIARGCPMPFGLTLVCVARKDAR